MAATTVISIVQQERTPLPAKEASALPPELWEGGLYYDDGAGGTIHLYYDLSDECLVEARTTDFTQACEDLQQSSAARHGNGFLLASALVAPMLFVANHTRFANQPVHSAAYDHSHVHTYGPLFYNTHNTPHQSLYNPYIQHNPNNMFQASGDAFQDASDSDGDGAGADGQSSGGGAAAEGPKGFSGQRAPDKAQAAGAAPSSPVPLPAATGGRYRPPAARRPAPEPAKEAPAAEKSAGAVEVFLPAAGGAEKAKPAAATATTMKTTTTLMTTTQKVVQTAPDKAPPPDKAGPQPDKSQRAPEGPAAVAPKKAPARKILSAPPPAAEPPKRAAAEPRAGGRRARPAARADTHRPAVTAPRFLPEEEEEP